MWRLSFLELFFPELYFSVNIPRKKCNTHKSLGCYNTLVLQNSIDNIIFNFP